tara:strand:+ start:61 stop:792 length:732 start_codon:yes stop_codon:yes gene_type:complete
MLDDFFVKGFCVIPDVIPNKLLKKLEHHETTITAHHGFDYENNYITGISSKFKYIQYSTNEISTELSNKVKKYINEYIYKLLPDSESYGTGSFICQKPGWQFIAPHLDTPNRFVKYNKTTELLGVHAFIPIEKFSKDTGGTAFLPGSQNYFIDHWGAIEGKYQDLFLDNCEQINCNGGDLILFNTRCLHSSMPNTSDKLRRALSIVYVKTNVLEELKQLVENEDKIYNEKMQTGEDMITRDIE